MVHVLVVGLVMVCVVVDGPEVVLLVMGRAAVNSMVFVCCTYPTFHRAKSLH